MIMQLLIRELAFNKHLDPTFVVFKVTLDRILVSTPTMQVDFSTFVDSISASFDTLMPVDNPGSCL